MGFRSKYRRSPQRTLVVLLLGFVFCVSAVLAGGTFDSGTDPSRASTRILTPEEAAAQTAQDADGESAAAPTLLVALLLLVGGSLLLSLALPTRGEKRREREAVAAAPAPATPAPAMPAPAMPVDVTPPATLAHPVLAYAPPRADTADTTVLPRIVVPPAPSSVADETFARPEPTVARDVPARPSPLLSWYESKLPQATPAPPPLIAWCLAQRAKAPVVPPCPQFAWYSAQRDRPAAVVAPAPTPVPVPVVVPAEVPVGTERRRVGPVRRAGAGPPPREAEPEARHLSVVHPTPPGLIARAG